MQVYEYIGSQINGFKGNGFLTPIFLSNGNAYVQKVEQDKAIEFYEVPMPKSEQLTTPRVATRLSVGESAFYCFCVQGGEALEGRKEEIQGELSALLSPSSGLNPHAKLMIANFLNLYKTQINLIRQANAELKKIGVENSISVDAAFKSSTKGNLEKIAEQIVRKSTKLAASNPLIDFADVAFIKQEKAYFDGLSFELDAVFSRDVALNSEQDKVLGAVLEHSYSIDKHSFHKLDLESKLPQFYQYLLLSSSFLPDQKMIEGKLTSRSLDQLPSSVIDIGLDIDRKLAKHSKTKNTNRSIDIAVEQSINKSLEEIIESFHKVTKDEYK